MRFLLSLAGRFVPSLLPGLSAFLNPWVLVVAGGIAVAGFTAGLRIEALRWDASLKDIAVQEAAQTRDWIKRQAATVADLSGKLAAAKADRHAAQRNFEEALAHAPKESLVEIECPVKKPVRAVAHRGGDAGVGLKAPPAAEPDAAVGAHARLSDRYRRLWNDALGIALPSADRAAWIDGANAASGPVEADDSLRNLAANAELLGQCRDREVGWQEFARRNGMTPQKP